MSPMRSRSAQNRSSSSGVTVCTDPTGLGSPPRRTRWRGAEVRGRRGAGGSHPFDVAWLLLFARLWYFRTRLNSRPTRPVRSGGTMTRTAALSAALLAALLLAAPGCNLIKLTANSPADVLEVAAPGLAMESDVQLARDAAPGQIKTVEGFLLASPDNRKIIRILAQGYCEYAFGFLDDDIEELEMAGKIDEAAPIGRRATGLYLRCLSYGLRLLGPGWEKDIYGRLDAFEKRGK